MAGLAAVMVEAMTEAKIAAEGAAATPAPTALAITGVGNGGGK